MKFNENVDISHPNLWDSMKVVLRGKLIALSALIKKLNQEERRQEIFELRAEINQIDTNLTTQESKKLKSGILRESR